MKLVNIGCGSTFHAEWINLDLTSHSKEVTACDLRKGLPFADSTIDVCYSSHVLEHLDKTEADQFLAEQFRVLHPEGIIRIAVPDLETICRNYLRYLEEASHQGGFAEFCYDYSLLELFDQTARTKSGGELRKLWESSLSPAQKAFALARSGEEFQKARRPERLHRKRPFLKRARNLFTRVALTVLHGKDAEGIHQVLQVRQSGELHKAMYDRFSLSRLLADHNFRDIRVCLAHQSRIPNFSCYELESVNGTVRKPDSLFMEAAKS